MAQAFLHAGEHRLVVAGLDVDHPVGNEPSLGDRRREEVGTGDAPENLALRPRGDACAEESRCRAVDGTVSAAGDLMQRAERKPTAGQTRVDLSDPEREHRSGTLRAALDPFDLGA